MRIPPLRTPLRPLWAVALACTALFATPAPGQIQPTGGFCWRGRPAPDCNAFLVAEGKVYMPLGGSRYSRTSYRGGTTTQSLELTWYVAWELGVMANMNENNALGATVLLGGDANGSRLGLKGRYRHWLDRATALDVGAGILRAGRSVPRENAPGNDHVPAVGLTGNASLGFTEWASVGVQADVLFSSGADEPATAWYLGTRLGTRPALVATAAPLVLAAVAFLFVGSGSP